MTTKEKLEMTVTKEATRYFTRYFNEDLKIEILNIKKLGPYAQFQRKYEGSPKSSSWWLELTDTGKAKKNSIRMDDNDN